MKNKDLLLDFLKYAIEHPELRFWQALDGWSGKRIAVEHRGEFRDAFYLDSKNFDLTDQS